MNYTTVTFAAFIIFYCSSCGSSEEATFIIENQSDFDVDSLYIQPDANNQYLSIKAGESAVLIADMRGVNTDGAYTIAYRNLNTGAWVRDNFGYYSNGIPQESELIYLIEGAEQPGYDEQKQGLINSLSELRVWDYTNDADVDSLAWETGLQMVALLEQTTLAGLDSLDNITVTTSPDGKINLYTFSYYSGGTAGDIYNPVIQWTKSDGSYGAYALFRAAKSNYFGLETWFDEIYPLPAEGGEFYLLLGKAKGSSRILLEHALVIQQNNDYLILDYPAFLGKASTIGLIDDVTSKGNTGGMIYNEANATLTINDIGPADEFGFMNDSYGIVEPITIDGPIVFAFEGEEFVLK